MLIGILIPLLLCGFGAGTLAWLIASHRAAQQQTTDATEQEFAQRQFARRCQISGLIVALGVALLGGNWVGYDVRGLLYWLGVLLLVVWIIVQALADVVAIQYHYRRQHDDHLRQRQLLEEEVRRAQAGLAGGRAKSPPPGSEHLPNLPD